MISVNRIKFNELSNVDLDLIVDVAFDSDSGDSNTFLNREAVANESYDGKFRRVHQYKYKDVFAPVFTFVKRDFTEFTFDEQRKVLAWLTSKSTASFLSVYYDDSDVITWEALGGWTEIKTFKNANNRTIGVVAVFEATTPWALSPIKSTTQTITKPGFINMRVDSDCFENLIYPRITIQQNGLVIELNSAPSEEFQYIDNTTYKYINNGNYVYTWKTPSDTVPQSSEVDPNLETTSVTLMNVYDSSNISTTTVKENKGDETIVIDGANQIISSSSPHRIFGDDFNWDWPYLSSGQNTFMVIGNCTITFEWREPIKCGEW